MAQGLIEKVQVPNVKRKGALATCIRLLAPSEAPETGVEQSASQTREEGSSDSVDVALN